MCVSLMAPTTRSYMTLTPKEEILLRLVSKSTMKPQKVQKKTPLHQRGYFSIRFSHFTWIRMMASSQTRMVLVERTLVVVLIRSYSYSQLS